MERIVGILDSGVVPDYESPSLPPQLAHDEEFELGTADTIEEKLDLEGVPRLIRLYSEADQRERDLIDEVMVNLTGYCFSSLMAMSRGGETYERILRDWEEGRSRKGLFR